MEHECDFCGYQTDTETYPMIAKGEEKRLCLICASTRGGLAHEYPSQYEGQVALLKTVCWISNHLASLIANET